MRLVIPPTPITTAFDFGDVVLVRVPFRDQAGHKQRPAAVVSSAACQSSRPGVILLAITSQVQSPPGVREVTIDDWHGVGLLEPSCFKPILFTAQRSLLRKKSGALTTGD